jgi:hypothetical protein
MRNGAPKFPVVCIRHSPEHDNEDLYWHQNEDAFTSVDASDVKRRWPVGMLVVDAKGAAWRIVGLIDHGAKGAGWKKWLRIVFQGDRRVSYDLEDQPAIPFEGLKERVAAAISSNPEFWRNDEAIAGEDGEPQDEQAMQDARTARVRRAKDMRALIKALDWAMEH